MPKKLISSDPILSTDEVRLSQMLKALGNPIRFRIIQTLAERLTCITGEIVETTPLAQSTVSQHLKVLREAGLIRGEIEGPATCYCLDNEGIRWLKDQIEAWLPGCCNLPGGQREDQLASFLPEEVQLDAIRKAYLRPEMSVAEITYGSSLMSARLAPLVEKVYVFREITHLAQSLLVSNLDVIFANMVLHHCPDPLSAIQEMVRALRPGGRLVITGPEAKDQIKTGEDRLQSTQEEVWQGFDLSQVRGWLEQAGFVNIIINSTGTSCCSGTQSEKAADSEQPLPDHSVFLATGTRQIKAQGVVQKHYGAIANSQEGSSCCTSPTNEVNLSCCSNSQMIPLESVSDLFVTGYTPEEQSLVPNQAAEISLGCGNPIALAALQPGEVVLDIGSGGGIDVFLAARKVGPSGKAIGIDMTPAMLYRARKTAREAKLENVEFRHGHADSLPVEADSIDVILSNCVINLTEDKGRVFREAYRVLRPAGRLEISDTLTDSAFPAELRARPENWGNCIFGALPEQEYIDLIAQAGFKDIHVQRSPHAGEVEGVKIYSAIIRAKKQVD